MSKYVEENGAKTECIFYDIYIGSL